MISRVLVVDDDPAILSSVSEILSEDGRIVTSAENGIRALAVMERADPHVVLTDVRMPDMDGIQLLREIKARRPDIDVIMMTAFDDMPTVVTSMRDGAVDFLVKPLELQHLRTTIRRVFDDRRSRSRATPVELVPQAAGLVGRAPEMIAIYKLIGQAAATRATVLIRGESGTGKEIVANAIHANAANATEPFVPVNCAALPASLLESE